MDCDFIVIGAGIAGASVAAELTGSGRVVLLERESHAGYHTTGRSAAQFTITYGPPIIRALSRASERHFHEISPPGGSGGLLRQRDVLFVARPDQSASFDRLCDELGDTVAKIGAAEARNVMPLLREGYVLRAAVDRSAADVDVNGLHQYYLRWFREQGGVLCTNEGTKSIGRSAAGWTVETPTMALSAPVVINAAGAWADEVAKDAGLAPLGIVPRRRTALLVDVPEAATPDGWPMVVDVDEEFYLKPDASRLLISPADETPSPPCDAQPEELDVAICVDRIERAFDLGIRRIEHKWAGLRSFFPDGTPVAGYDDSTEGFFWLAGQGGYGIQTAPAVARTAAALVLGAPVPADIADQGVTETALSPRRLR